MSDVPAIPAAEKEAEPSPPRTLLRLKRSARDEPGYDQLVSRKRRKVGSTPQTFRFRRLLSSNPETPIKNRRVIDVDLAMLIDSPSSSCGPSAPSTPLKPAEVESQKAPVATPSNTAVTANSATDDAVYDLYEEVNPADETSAVANTRIGWLDSTMLPAEFFGELIPSDDDDCDYSEGDERSVDYPSTPSSSVDSTDLRAEDGDDDDISETEIGYLDRVLDMNLLRDDAFQPPAYNTRSRLRTQQTSADDHPTSPQSK